MGAELFLVALAVAAFLCVGLTIASVGWRGDTDHDIEMLKLRCGRLEEQARTGPDSLERRVEALEARGVEE